MKQAVFVAIWVLFAIVGWDSPSTTKPSGPHPGVDLGSLIAFPVHPRGSNHNAALAQGKLIVRGGCLRLQGIDAPEYSLLIYWPHGYSYRKKSGSIEVLDDVGKFVATVDDYLSMSGGEYKGDITEGRCKGPIWFAGSVDPAPKLSPKQ